MCVIIHKPAGKPILKERLHRLWTRNPDGGGIAYIDRTGILQAEKALHWEEWWEIFSRVNKEHGKNSEILIHMRIATHGSICQENTHPFWVNETTVMAHNGIITEYMPKKTWDPELKKMVQEGEDLSDTRLFMENVLRELPEDWLDKPGLTELVADFLGKSNKMMFLTSNPSLKYSVYIINPSAGTEVDGLWFSNSYGVVQYTPLPQTNHNTDPLRPHPQYNENGKWISQQTNLAEDKLLPLPISVRKQTKAQEREAKKRKEEHYPDNAKSIYLVITGGTAEEANLLKARKHGLGIVTPITPSGGYWECEACDTMIDANTNYCACWDVVCLKCTNFAAQCICNIEGIPDSLLSYTDYMELTDPKGKEQPIATKTPTTLTDDELTDAIAMAPE